MSRIELEKPVFDEIIKQAEAEYPSECCGWIIEQKDGSHIYRPSENLQDKYHKLDPEAYPRTSHDAFLINTMKLNREIEEAAASGGRLFSIVHSHIDTGAYFSDEDKKQMSEPDMSKPVFDADNFLVVAVREGRYTENAVFRFDTTEKDYIKNELALV